MVSNHKSYYFICSFAHSFIHSLTHPFIHLIDIVIVETCDLDLGRHQMNAATLVILY